MDDRSSALAATAVEPDTLPGVAIRVPGHYCGPPGIVNGGWAAGIVAGLQCGPDTAPGTPVEVTLRAPVPLDAPVTGHCGEERAVLVDAGGAELAESRVVAGIAPPPPFVPAVEAEHATRAGNRVESPFPGCYVCGLERRGGLRVTVGRTTGDGFAGVWTPPPATGELPARYVWAALDCPTGLVHLADGGRALLGRLTLARHRAVTPGEPLVVVAAATGAERRKRFSTAALYSTDGTLVANSSAVWLTI